MILKHISILNYKNLEQVELAFSAETEYFFRAKRNGKDELAGCCLFPLFL